MRGTGKTALAAGATGTISGSDVYCWPGAGERGHPDREHRQLAFRHLVQLQRCGDTQQPGRGHLHRLRRRRFHLQQQQRRHFNNAGSFVRNGVRDTIVNYGVAFNNSGTVDLQQGALRLQGGGSHTGDLTTATGTTLEIGGNHTFAAGTDITGGGSLLVNGGSSTSAGVITLGGTLTLVGSALTTWGRSRRRASLSAAP